jgi:hypothetical protein
VTIINNGFGPGPFTVDVAVDNLNSTAINGVDFTFANQTVTFSSANDTQSITFTIIDDCIKEFPESIVLKLSNPSNAFLGADSINNIIIAQNDFGPTAFFTAPTIYNVPASFGLDSVAVHLSNAFCGPVTVYYTTTGTASNGVDYTGVASNDSVIFNPGETVKYIIASVVDDLIIESTESINYKLDSISRGFMGAVTTSTVNIIDNDFPAPSVDFINTSSSHIESAGLIQIPVQVLNMSATTIFVTATLVSGTANIATDLSASTVQTISFTGGSSATQNVIFTIIDDALIEGNEQFTIVLSNPIGGAVIGANSTFTVSIVDNDFAGLTPSIQFQSSAITCNEGNAVVNVPVTATNVNANPINVNFAVNAGSCIAGLDYVVITSSPFSLPAFNVLGNIQINVIDDALIEGTENFSVTLSSPTNANLGSLTTSVITIIDNDFMNGISNVSSTSIEVFPNPAASSSALIFKGLQNGIRYNLEVINRVGAKIMQEAILNDRIDLAPFNLVSGVYFYRISNANGIQKSGKLIIE